MKPFILLVFLLNAAPLWAEILVPVRTIRAKEIITGADLMLKNANVPGALSKLSDFEGQEARVALYPGRPVRPGDVGPAALVGRNDIVTLIFRQGGLHIITEGRALGRGAAGEVIQIMNLTSRSTVTGRIRADGSIEVK
ncbi:MAG: flagellar basal body P-ring formation chaperone FlgA [Sedimentitalea sp.]